MHSGDSQRRLRPRLFDTDWLVLRGIARELTRLVCDHVQPGCKVVDFGCGDMPYRTLVEARGGVYVGADFGNSADVTIGDTGQVPIPSGSADVVISCQVLEHVRDIDSYLGEIARMLKPGGVLLLSTHGTWLYHPHPEDHRRWTRTGLINEIETRGFAVHDVDAIVGPLATTTLIRLAGYSFLLRRLSVFGALLASIVAIAMNSRAWIEERLTPEHIRCDNACVYMTSCTRLAA
ncbi:MAG TPA: class I SAM-dependent methyltransferase [Sphingomicrobium sp.]|nr:class I SAM-dependent methyltransferase [Sphingomicrobium sp.]